MERRGEQLALFQLVESLEIIEASDVILSICTVEDVSIKVKS
jgi:hypothetical protein